MHPAALSASSWNCGSWSVVYTRAYSISSLFRLIVT